MINAFMDEYRWLSNFWFVPVELDGVSYSSVEHAYQAAKTLDLEARERIRAAKDPGAAKRLGKGVVLRADWQQVRVQVMRDLVRQKFQQPYLAQKLLDTGDQELVEGNWWGDTFWGVCKGKGENHLGKILMDTRQELRR